MKGEKDERKKFEENLVGQKDENHHKSRNLWPPVFAVILTAYAAFTLLDAFVIPGDVVSLEELARSEDAVESELPDEVSGEASGPVITESSYTSDGIAITITTLERHDTQIYVADVVLSDASYLKTGLAGGTFGRNISETTSEIAKENDAILAINGDYYGFRKRGFVMRNGYLYRDMAQNDSGQEDLVVYEDGRLEIVTESEADASELAEAGAAQIFSFGPGLIEDGEIAVEEGSEVEQAMRSNPRTAIGEIEPLHYVFVVSDGRTKESAGLTLLELAEVMQELGCETAYNLDGGGSSTMWFMGGIVNHPTNGHRSGERSVSDIVYISES
ncbi:MAG: phosphodiester glycosidase family protein [Clostridiales bacterium]|nr:phosphodiester glycosidase family protein [Clostridiales bacterium]